MTEIDETELPGIGIRFHLSLIICLGDSIVPFFRLDGNRNKGQKRKSSGRTSEGQPIAASGFIH